MTSTHELPGQLDGGGSSKETWKSEIRAAMAVWATAFNTNWPQLTITFEAAENTVDDGEELPNRIDINDTYDLPHEKGIGDFRFGQHSIESAGTVAHAWPPADTFLTSYGRSDEGGYGGDIHFDLAKATWRADTELGGEKYSILMFAVHELGHSFGLTHVGEQPGTPNWKPVMYPSMATTVNFRDDTGERPYNGSVTVHDLNCLKSLYEDGPPAYLTDCNIDHAGGLNQGWPSIIAAIDRINNEGSTSEAITITYSFYVDFSSPKLHKAGSGKLASSGTKLKYHDQTEADLCCGDCVYCEDGKVPKAWKVKIKGFKDITTTPHDDCTTCSVDYNKTFIVPRDDLPGDAACRWDVEFSDLDECYDHYSIGVTIAGLPGSYALNVSWSTSTGFPFPMGEQVDFQESYVSKPLCINLNDGDPLEMNLNFAFIIRCDASDASCTITPCY